MNRIFFCIPTRLFLGAVLTVVALSWAGRAHGQSCDARGVIVPSEIEFPLNANIAAMDWFDLEGNGQQTLVAGLYSYPSSAISSFWKLGPSGWTPMGTRRASVIAMAMFDNGSGRSLFAAVDYALLQWQNGQWQTAVNSTLIGDRVLALQEFDDGTGPALYIGIDNQQTTARTSVLRLRNGALEGVGIASQLSGKVQGFAVFDEDGAGPNPPRLFAVGQVNVNSTPVIAARWDGAQWTSVGTFTSISPWCKTVTGISTGSLRGLYVSGHGLPPVAGSTSISQSVMKWDGNNWGLLPGNRDTYWINAMTGVRWTLRPVVEPSGAMAMYMRGDLTYRFDGSTVKLVRGVNGLFGLTNGNGTMPLVVMPARGAGPMTLLCPQDVGSGLGSTRRLSQIALCLASPADINADGRVGVDDLLAYVDAWLAQRIEADYIYVRDVNSNDLFAYLNAWLLG